MKIQRFINHPEYVNLICVEGRFYTKQGFKRIHQRVSLLPFTVGSYPKGDTYECIGVIIDEDNLEDVDVQVKTA